MQSRWTIVGGGILVLLAVLLGIRYWPSDGAVLLTPADPPVVAHGKVIYVENCASCHGERLEGQENWRERRADGRLPAPPHDETGHTWHHPDTQLFDIVKRGTEAVVGGDYRSDMPGYGESLSDDEIIAVLSFIKSTWPAKVREMHDQMNRR